MVFSLARGRVRSPPHLALVFAALALWCVLAVVGRVARADLVSVPLCEEKHGFAGEFNDHFSIPVETAPDNGEAIVLIARAFPTEFGAMLEKWLYLSATYYLAEGPEVTRTSDNNGILELPNVAPNSEIEVWVKRVRVDGPVPFRFFSFFANKPVCHVSVSPQNSFLAPVPHRLQGSAKPVTMYFKTTLPTNVNAAMVDIVADGHAGSPFQVMAKDGTWQPHVATDLIQSSTGSGITFAFSPSPDDTATAYCFTSVFVSYATVQGGTSASTTPPGKGPTAAPPSSPQGGGGAPTATTTPASTAAPSSPSMSLLRRVLWLALLCFVAWQATQSVYNFRVLGKRDVMEIIPCAEMVAAGARGVQLAASRGLGMTQRRADGYDSVQGMNDPYA